jgi:adenylate cyclase
MPFADGQGNPSRTGEDSVVLCQGGEDELKLRAARVVVIAGVIAAYGLGLLLPVDMAIRRQFAVAFAPEPDPRVVIVEIDDASISALGRWPWPRSLLAQLVSEVSERNPAAIGIDIMLSEPEVGTANDAALAAAIAQSGRVVLPAYVQSYSLPQHVQWYVSQTRPLLPIVELGQAARGLGHVSAICDPDGAVRRVPAVMGVADGFVPAFAAEVVRVGVEAGALPGALGGGLDFRPGAQAAVGECTIPLDSTSSMSPVFPWPPAGERISAAELLTRTPPDASAEGSSRDEGSSRCPPDLAGKFVLIGVTAAGIGDSHETPLSARYGAAPGLMVHAAAVNSILTGRFVRPVHAGAALFAVACFGALLGVVSGAISDRGRGVGAAVLLHVGACASVLAGSTLLYARRGVWMGPSAPVLVSILLLAVELYSRASSAGRFRAALRKYVGVDSPEAAGAQAQAGARDMAVMLVDLRGWTAASYHMEPEAAARLVNSYLSVVADTMAEHGGRVERFPGDAVLAVFEGRGREDLACSVRAARAARGAVRAVAIGQCMALGVGIGIAYGRVARVELGGADRSDLTVIGTAVNIAKALEDAAAEDQILVGVSPEWVQDLPSGLTPWDGRIAKIQPGTVALFEIM